MKGGKDVAIVSAGACKDEGKPLKAAHFRTENQTRRLQNMMYKC
jgi:hypothetical protein